MHILAPLVRDLQFPEVRRFAKAMAKMVERRVPKIATTTWAVKDRTGVFVDYGQNARDRTIASAYSIRPTPDARASAPLRWDEVADVDPADFTLQTMRDRIKKVGDLTSGMWERAVSIADQFDKVGEKPPGKGPKPRKRTGLPRDWRAEYEAKKKSGESGWG
jgi:DNA primase